MIGSWIIKRMARADYERWNRGDPNSVVANWADDIVVETISAQGLPVALKGKRAAEEWLRSMYEEWPKPKFTVRDICIREVFPFLSAFLGTCVVMSDWSVIQTHKRGREFKYDGVSVVHVRRGKIVRMSDYYSGAALSELEAIRKLGGGT